MLFYKNLNFFLYSGFNIQCYFSPIYYSGVCDFGKRFHQRPHSYGIGNWLQRSRILLLVSLILFASLMFRMTSSIASAIIIISFSFIPRVVAAGVPMRMPLVMKGLFVSKGIVFSVSYTHLRAHET